MVSKKTKKVVKKKPARTYDVFHCPKCGGFIKEIVRDMTTYLNQFEVLNDDGYYEVDDEDCYDSQTNDMLCRVCESTAITQITVTEEVFRLLITRFKNKDVVPYTYKNEVTVDLGELMNGNI